MLDIQVIDDPAAATVALEPMRSRLLSELAEPASAATLAARVGLARQKVNYHLNALEAHGLVRLAQERKWGGLTERLLVATATSYVVSPGALGPVAAIRVGKRRSAVRELPHRPGRTGRPRGGRPCSSCERHGQTPGDPGGGYRGSLPVGDGPGGVQPNSPRPSRNSSRSTTMNPPPAAARIAW
jgi:DNA-binding transcriptional ArsR family regulator